MLWRRDAQRELIPVQHAKICHFDPNKRLLFILPGLGVADHSDPKQIAGGIKYMEQVLKPTREAGFATDIVLSTYEQPYEDYGLMQEYYHPTVDFTNRNHEVARALDFRLMPFLGDDFMKQPPEEMKKRLSHVTLVGYSYGTVVAQTMAKHLYRNIAQVHGVEKASEIMQSLVSVHMANMAQALDVPYGTQCYFAAQNDTTARNIVRRLAQPGYEIQTLERVGYGEEKPLLKRPRVFATENTLMVRFYAPEKVEWVEPHPQHGHTVGRVLDPVVAEEANVTVQHDIRNFLYGNDIAAGMLWNVINNAVQRGVGPHTAADLVKSIPEVTRARLQHQAATCAVER